MLRVVTRLLLPYLCSAIAMAAGVGCGARSDFHFRVAGEYFVWRSSSATVKVAPRIRDSATPIIPSKVTQVAWDSKYVVAERRLPKSPGPPEYWILDVSVPKVYGPFGADAFPVERRRLGVPDRLVLRPVTEFRHLSEGGGQR